MESYTTDKDLPVILYYSYFACMSYDSLIKYINKNNLLMLKLFCESYKILITMSEKICNLDFEA